MATDSLVVLQLRFEALQLLQFLSLSGFSANKHGTVLEIKGSIR